MSPRGALAGTQITMRFVATAVAVLVGALAGLVLYLVLGTL